MTRACLVATVTVTSQAVAVKLKRVVKLLPLMLELLQARDGRESRVQCCDRTCWLLGELVGP